MKLLNNILKIFVGDKSEKDIKAIQPFVKQMLKFEQAFENLSHDELRAKTMAFKQKIQDAIVNQNDAITAIKIQIETTLDEVNY